MLEPGTIYASDDHPDTFKVVLPGSVSRLLKNSRGRRFLIGEDVERKSIGRLPPDRLDATEWREEYRFPPDAPAGAKFRWTGLKWVWSLEEIMSKEAAEKLYRNLQVNEKVKTGLFSSKSVIAGSFQTPFAWRGWIIRGQDGHSWDAFKKHGEETVDSPTLPGLLDGILDKEQSQPKTLEGTKKMTFPGPVTAVKFLGKYAAIFAAFTFLTSPAETVDKIKAWWTAPVALELGDWVKIRTCDSCRTVSSDGVICRQCGGEKFSERKAQTLFEDHWNWQRDHSRQVRIRGHIFEDGTRTLEPGNWLLPEIEVRS